LQEEMFMYPRPLVEAARASDAVVMASSDLEFLFSKTIEDILSAGVRIVALPYLTEEGIVRMLPASGDEVQSLRETTERITRVFEKSHSAKVISDAGTDLTVNVGQYPILPHLGVAGKGKWTILPAGQITNIPNDKSAEGTLVIDRTIAANDYKEIGEPVKFTIKHGNVVNIEGGVEAEKLSRFLEDLKHENMYHLTEVAVGVNPKCKFSGIGAPAEDTHALGCVSLALGCDLHLGGSHSGPAHIDMTMRYPSITLDGNKPIVEEGRLVA
jgi:2,5-dihydroxypyridine 5,6-dioxygenase